MGNYITPDAISAKHKWLTIANFEHSDVILIQAWYWNPKDFLKHLTESGVSFEVIKINRDIPSEDKCWTCGLPVESGEKFCNQDCENAHSLNVLTDEK